MSAVFLTTVLYSALSGSEHVYRVATIDMNTCAVLAQRWAAYRAGSMRVLSATCEVPRPASTTAGRLQA